jgi:histidinol-phosphate aminotransferase
MSRFFLPHIQRLVGYVPGEQPRDPTGIIKLNTNENPYPPSPRVADAIRVALNGRLRLYPDPVGTEFRLAAARLHGVDPDMILVGNGSDDLLTVLTRAFVGPEDVVVYPTPSYILYRTLAEIQNARPVMVPFEADWSLDPKGFGRPEAKLTFLANPNSPSGTALGLSEIRGIAERVRGPLVIDEAYVDFATSNAIGLIADYPHLIVTRSLSKGYGLAGLRVGYLIAHPDVVRGLIKVKDSYNCDLLSLLGGAAALEDQDYLNETRTKILNTRQRLTVALRSQGFVLPESQANFVWCQSGWSAVGTYEALKDRKILVRLMSYPNVPQGLRITVGTDNEIDVLIQALQSLNQSHC